MKIIIYRCSVTLPLEQTTQFTVPEVSGTFYLVSNQLALTDEEQISFTLGLLKSFTQDDSVTFLVPDSLKKLLLGWNFEMWKDTELDPELSVAQHKSHALMSAAQRKSQSLKKAILQYAGLNAPLESIEFTEMTDTLPKPKSQPVDTGVLQLFGSIVETVLEPVYFSFSLATVMLIAIMLTLSKDTLPYVELEKHLQQGRKEFVEEELKKFEDGADKRRLQIAIHEAPTITTPSAATQSSPTPEEFYMYQVQPGDNPTSISKNCYEKYSGEQWDNLLKDNPQFNSSETLKAGLKAGQKLRIRNPVNKKCKQ